MGQTWYLAVDMQLFFVSPLFIYPLWRWRKWGLVWLTAVALACQTIIFYVYARDDLSPTLWVTRAYVLSQNILLLSCVAGFNLKKFIF